MTEPSEKMVRIIYCGGVERNSLYIDDYRVTGQKPWGGGSIIKEWEISYQTLLMVPAIAKAIEKARMEERERCAKLICEMCENALPLTKRNDGSYWHDDPEGAACEASDIRQVRNHEKKP